MNNILIGGGIHGRAGRSRTTRPSPAARAPGPGRDGMSGVHTHMTNTLNTPVEALETAYPLRVLEYRLRDGTGATAGGAAATGSAVVLEVLADGRPCRCSPSGGATRRGASTAASPAPPGATRSFATASRRALPAKVTFPVEPGDVLLIETPGGGGFGHTRERKE